MPTTAEILQLKPRTRTATKVNATDVFTLMGFNFGTEYEFNSGSTHPDANTVWVDNETDYLDRFTFLIGSPPPWAQVVELWAVARLDPNNKNMPGELKISPFPYDHDDWALCPSDVRRQMKKDEFPCLYAWIGDKFNDVNTEEDEFGLPMASDVAIYAGGDEMIYGDIGGEKTVEVGGSGMPSHNHDLLDSILKKNGTIDVVTNAVLLGIVLTKTTINASAEIGSSQATGTASESGSPTEVDIQNPFICGGNLFINVGRETE